MAFNGKPSTSMFRTLVDTQTLAAHLDDPQWVVIDCRFKLSDPAAGKYAYDSAHIPNARYAHLNDDLSGPVTVTSGRHPLPDPAALAQRLGQWGIDGTKQVVVYDDSFGAMAARLWWLLRWLGHDAVAVLDGGLQVWQREGRGLSAIAPAIQAAVFHARVNDALWVSTAAVARMAAQRSHVIIDARAEERFRGEVEPFDKVAGHIPGALNVPFEDNLDLGGTFLPATELADLYRTALGDKTPTHTIHMCGSGVTACHNLLAMEHAGLVGAKLYVGSWSEWITDSRRAVVQ